MAKIALINDQHWGVRNDSDIFFEYQMQFYNNVFFPTMEERGIKILINGGDFTDRRKYINFKTLSRVRKEYVERLNALGVEQHNVIGNHDVFYKNTNTINSMSELFGNMPNCHIYDSPTELEIDGTKILLVPWINPENQEETYRLLTQSDARFVYGHLELKGFKMYANSIEAHGMDPDVFGRFEKVMSGHFHHKSQKRNITYLGAPCEYTWSDYNDPRGFHIFDTDTGELEYIKNPYRMFRKLYYNDDGLNPIEKQKMISELKSMGDHYKNRYVKLMVRKKNDPHLFERMIDTLYSFDPADLKIMEDVAFTDEDADSVNMAEDTLTVLNKHIDQMPDINDKYKGKLKELFGKLHIEAMELED